MISLFVDYTDSAETTVTEDGQQVYPCRCGKTHRGVYALYDYMHHECYHTEYPLVWLDDDRDTLLCGSCGETFAVEK